MIYGGLGIRQQSTNKLRRNPIEIRAVLGFSGQKSGTRIVLRQNPPEVRVTSRQKSDIIYIILQTSVRLFEISSQKNSFLATPIVETNVCIKVPVK